MFMVVKVFLLLWSLGLQFGGGCAVNILYIEGVPSPSHHVWNKVITYALAAKGYNMTIISTDVEKTNLKNIHYIRLEKSYEILNTVPEYENFIALADKPNVEELATTFLLASIACEGAMQSAGYRQLLNYPKDFKFDLVVNDYILGPCLLGLVERFNNPPLVGATAYFGYQFAAPLASDALAYPLHQHMVLRSYDETSFFSRFENLFYHAYEYAFRQWYLRSAIQKIVNEHHGSYVDVWEMEKRYELILINSDKALDVAQPMAPNVIPVGGLQCQSSKPLPKDFEAVYNRSEKGVILFSLGTNVKSEMLGPERINHFIEAFRSMSGYEIFWKATGIDSSVLPKNVHVRAWMPQNDMLANPKTKLFITHGGLLSTQEATRHGVPMIGMPVFVDQFSNVDNCVKRGTGEKLLFADLDTSRLRMLMEKVLSEPKYSENAKVRAKLFFDQKEMPLERAIWWIEWVLRNPKVDVFHTAGKNLNTFQRLSLDCYLFTIALIIVLFKVILFGSRKLAKTLCRKKSSNGTGKVKKQ